MQLYFEYIYPLAMHRVHKLTQCIFSKSMYLGNDVNRKKTNHVYNHGHVQDIFTREGGDLYDIQIKIFNVIKS